MYVIMKINNFTIINYKNLKNVTIELDKNLTTIVGENGSGKTNFFDAISVFFDKNPIYKLNENSFNANLKNIKGNWIIFSIEVSEIGDTAEETVILKNGDNKGRVTLFYRPKMNIRKRMHILSNDYINEKDIVEKTRKKNIMLDYLDNIDINFDYDVNYSQYCIFDLTSEDEYSKIVGDFNELIFPNPSDDDKTKLGNEITFRDFLNISNVTYVPAIRNATRDFLKNQNVLSKLVKEYTSSSDPNEWKDIQKAIKEINTSLENVRSLNEFSGSLNDQIKLTVGNIYNQGLGYKVLLSEDSNEITKNFELVSTEYARRIPVESRSLGDNNITFFALKLLENKLLFSTNKSMLNILLIEEPEAHIHKHLQKSLFAGVKNIEGNQIILSTHSVHISEAANISKVRVFVKKRTEIVVCNPSYSMDAELIQIVERYLDSKRIPILFSKNIILVEGTAELLLIPVMLKMKYNLDLDELGISLVSMDSAFFKPISSLFSKERIKLHCAIITDEDRMISENVEDINHRIIGLNELAEKNSYLSIHTTKHTFEIDLLESNKEYIIKFIEEQNYYKRDFIKFKETINGYDKENRAKTFLSLVDRIGKGWFAMDLANYIAVQEELMKFNIPTYILDAINISIKNSEVPVEKVLDIIHSSKNVSESDYLVKNMQEGI